MPDKRDADREYAFEMAASGIRFGFGGPGIKIIKRMGILTHLLQGFLRVTFHTRRRR